MSNQAAKMQFKEEAELVNKDRVRLLVEALRSGEFTQGRNMLHRITNNRHTYCCLGVACEVAIRNGLAVDQKESLIVGTDTTSIVYDGRSGLLPEVVWHWYGFSVCDPSLLIESGDSSIRSTFANDCAITNYNFNDIADMFEKTYLND